MGVTGAQRAAADRTHPNSQMATTEAQANTPSTTSMITGQTTENKQHNLNADANSFNFKATSSVHNLPAMSQKEMQVQ